MITSKYILVFALNLLTLLDSKSQSYTDLSELTGFSIKAYYSPGNEERARVIVGRCERTIEYLKGLVGFKPKVNLFILNPEHWKKYATFPVYGMPHYPDSERLIIASEDNDFWKSFVPPLDQLPMDLANQIKKAYTTSDGTLSMMAFFDLLALHELGHAFHEQGGLTMQRLWMQELFCNIMLHTYIAEKEPMNLPALEAFPKWLWPVVQLVTSSPLWLTSKSDMIIWTQGIMVGINAVFMLRVSKFTVQADKGHS